ncbi:MAG: hypothetical protein ACM3X6_10555 [Patescibacteria group bacterium]
MRLALPADEEGLRVLNESPIAELITTDTVEPLPAGNTSKIRMTATAGLFAEAIARIHRRDSVSALFE